MTWRCLLGCLTMLSAGCVASLDEANDHEYGPNWAQGGNFSAHGHEELVSQAAVLANKELRQTRTTEVDSWLAALSEAQQDLQSGEFYPVEDLWVASLITQNRLVEGQVAADMPDRLFAVPKLGIEIPWTRFIFDAYCDHVAGTWADAQDEEARIEVCKKLPFDGRAQTVHFMRSFTETVEAGWPGAGGRRLMRVGGARKSCDESVQRIESAVMKGYDYWRQGLALTVKAQESNDGGKELRTQAAQKFQLMQVFIGVASHTAQDAFAPAHVQRDKDLKRIVDLCYFESTDKSTVVDPASAAGACVHKAPVDIRDRIWTKLNGAVCFGANYKCLVPLAQLAVQASAALYGGVAEILMDDWQSATAGSSDELPNSNQRIRGFLQQLFVSGTGPGMGYMDCSSVRP